MNAIAMCRLRPVLVLLVALACWSAPAPAQVPPTEPGPEETAPDEQAEEDGADAEDAEAAPAADEPADDESATADDPATEDEDATDAADAAAAEDESADAEATLADLPPVADEPAPPGTDWEPRPMREDEAWAPAVAADPADDAIASEPPADGGSPIWEVGAFEDLGDERPAPAPGPDTDRGSGEDMPVLRRPAKRAAPRPGAGKRPGAGDEDVPYSTGGEAVRQNGAPWQAQIYYPGKSEKWAEKLKAGMPLWQLQHYCGGTLIAPDWVLTAAHCIDDDMVKKGYRVRLGASDISRDEGMNFRIERIVRHSQYDDKQLPARPNMYANDIALIHIVDDSGPKPRPRDPERIRPIALYEAKLPAGAEVTGTGWGKTQPVDGHAPSAVLMKVDLQAMDTARCQVLPTYGPEKIHGKVICAAHPERSTCRGDSGGPLILTNGSPRLVGVISWGKKRCSGDGQPGVYTRIESYLGWIRQAMALDPTRGKLP